MHLPLMVPRPGRHPGWGELIAVIVLIGQRLSLSSGFPGAFSQAEAGSPSPEARLVQIDQPLTAPDVTPSTMYFCMNRYRIRIGSMARIRAASTQPISDPPMDP